MARMAPILALVRDHDIEQEMKIPTPELAGVRDRLLGLGAVLESARQLEENAVLDTSRDELRATGRLLRLRRFGEATILTFKGPASFASGVKSRLELESEVASAETMLAILAELGFTARRRYQKLRETWLLEGVTVALDETPLGCFVELEGRAGLLPPLALELGLGADAAVGESYQELWALHRAHHPEAPSDMVFEPEELARLLASSAEKTTAASS
jgi:adenylate cyclase, class 2